VVALHAFGSLARGAADSTDFALIVVVHTLNIYDEQFKMDFARAGLLRERAYRIAFTRLSRGSLVS
jgi:hypothetical protein